MVAPSPISGILFDKDGTLLDYARTWLPVNRELARFAAQGDGVLADRLLSACGMDPVSGYVVPDSLLAAGNTVEIATGFVEAGSPLSVAALTEQLDAMSADAARHAVPVTDLESFFRDLKEKGYRLGVASSDNERSIRETADRFGFAPYLDYVAGYDSGFGVKPEPGMVLGFCMATGLDPQEVAVVGDNNHDLHMGRNAGAGLTVAVLTGTGSRASLSAGSDHCLNDITELVSVLPSLQPV
ncbi:haloacid dehalogenase [Metarhizobium album]|uniref:phosphoglycolate phosphatase n=1 Tax=Metarhizobium album TaxID=2182425 RepID=A0A2U2DYL9_9HYPH|nr:HAD family hydrolase [Rhizobium album]PWE58393.1 haloacid dehalogenase [Rhizobium album]